MKRHLKRPTSRQLTNELICWCVQQDPKRLLEQLRLDYDATEAQAIIAIKRATRRDFIAWNPNGQCHYLLNRGLRLLDKTP